MLWEVWTLNHRMQQFFHRLENKLLGHEITAINENYLGTYVITVNMYLHQFSQEDEEEENLCDQHPEETSPTRTPSVHGHKWENQHRTVPDCGREEELPY